MEKFRGQNDLYYNNYNSRALSSHGEQDEENTPLFFPSNNCKHPNRSNKFVVANAFIVFLLFCTAVLSSAIIYYVSASWFNESFNSDFPDSLIVQGSANSVGEKERTTIEFCRIVEDDARCNHPLTEIRVTSGMSGSWPKELVWVLFKDHSKTGGTTEVIHLEDGTFEQDPLVRCGAYITSLCLNGDHVMYTNAKVNAGYYLSVCNQRIDSTKGLEFRIASGSCNKHWNINQNTSSLSFARRHRNPNLVTTISPTSSASQVPYNFSNFSLSPTSFSTSPPIKKCWFFDLICSSDFHETNNPTPAPTYNGTSPTETVTNAPTYSPTQAPRCWFFGLICQSDFTHSAQTSQPSSMPSSMPSSAFNMTNASLYPTSVPTSTPSAVPSAVPSAAPSAVPSAGDVILTTLTPTAAAP